MPHVSHVSKNYIELKGFKKKREPNNPYLRH